MAYVFRTVAVFNSPDEAFRAKAHLEAAGVAASLEVDAMAGWSWHDPTTTSVVRLSVPADEAEQARLLLADGAKDAATSSPPLPGGAPPDGEWPCPKCQTSVEAFLDVCWACGTTRDGVEDPEFQPAEVPIIDSPPDLPPSPWVAILLIACPPALVLYLLTRLLFRAGPDDAEPQAVDPPWPGVLADAGPVDLRRRRLEEVRFDPASQPRLGLPGEADAEAILARAWRTAVLGVVCLPPLLTLYSTWLLLKYLVLCDGAAHRRRWRLPVSLAINLGVLLVAGLVAFVQLALLPSGHDDPGLRDRPAASPR